MRKGLTEGGAAVREGLPKGGDALREGLPEGGIAWVTQARGLCEGGAA